MAENDDLSKLEPTGELGEVVYLALADIITEYLNEYIPLNSPTAPDGYSMVPEQIAAKIIEIFIVIPRNPPEE